MRTRVLLGKEWKETVISGYLPSGWYNSQQEPGDHDPWINTTLVSTDPERSFDSFEGFTYWEDSRKISTPYEWETLGKDDIAVYY